MRRHWRNCHIDLGKWDIFRHDSVTGQTIRVSVASDGAEANGNSRFPGVSDDGRLIIFHSEATNLVANDNNGRWDVFVHDCQSGVTERVSVSVVGTDANADCTDPAISADGTCVAYNSWATNLVNGDTNAQRDVFVFNRLTHSTQRVSVSSAGTQGNGISEFPALSGNGKRIVFQSLATNLVPGDTNGFRDIFVYDTDTNTIQRISLSSSGGEGNGSSNDPSISADGLAIAFKSFATNLVEGDTNSRVDIFVREGVTTTRVNLAEVSSLSDGAFHTGLVDRQANGDSWWPVISPNGRYVTFYSSANNLTDSDTNSRQDVFRYDRSLASLTRVSMVDDGNQGDGDSTHTDIASDGLHIAFASDATRLVPEDTNAKRDVFLTKPASFQPDLMMGVNAGMRTGEAVFIPYGQRGTPYWRALLLGRITMSYPITIRNAGCASDAFLFIGAPGGSGWSVHYFDAPVGGNDITVKVTGNGWRTPYLAPQQEVTYRVEWLPYSAPPGDLRKTLLVARSVTAPSQSDTIMGGILLYAAIPDLTIRRSDDTVDYGLSVRDINPRWDQTRSKHVNVGETTVFQCTLSNAGMESATLRVTGPGSDAVFSVRYFDAWTGGNDITDQVTGTGWLAYTGTTSARYFRVEATATSVARPGDGISLAVTGASVETDPISYDTVVGAVIVRGGRTERVSIAADEMQGNKDSGGSSSAAISSDGRYVAFQSYADTLVTNDTNGQSDIFVYDRQGDDHPSCQRSQRRHASQ